MRFRIRQSFDHPVEVVEAALLDPDFIARMGELPNLGRPQLLDREQNGDTVRLRARYAFVGDLSASVRAVVDPARLTWVQDETADLGTHRGRFTILPDHYAALLRAGGTFAIDPQPQGGSVRIAEGDVQVNVPFLGGKVERAIISGLEEQAAAEAELLREWAGQSHPS